VKFRRLATKPFRSAAAIAASFLLVGVSAAIPAQAASSDISMTYSSDNETASWTSGEHTANTIWGRVGKTRDDLQLVYTVKASSLSYPMPVIKYSGTWASSESGTNTFFTYKMRFGCDSSVTVLCTTAGYTTLLAAMNAKAQTYDGHSADKFSDEIGSIVAEYGSIVPLGITGTVNVSLKANTTGTGQLVFFLAQGNGTVGETDENDLLSPKVTAPFEVTQPVATTTVTGAFCAAFDQYTSGGTIYTPTGYGRSTFALTTQTTDDGLYPDDVTAIPVETSGLSYSIGSTDFATKAALTSYLLSASAGSYSVKTGYTAPDSIDAATTSLSVTVLAASDSRCFTTSQVASSASPSATASASADAAVTVNTGNPASNAPAVAAVFLGAMLVVASAGVGIWMRRTR